MLALIPELIHINQ